MTFSEQSRLLLGNWDAYQDVLRAHDKLTQELQIALLSIEECLKKAGVLNSGWHFSTPSDNQVYIWHDQWVQQGDPLVWIGVENASLKAIFGDESAAGAYVWVSKSNATSLIIRLRKLFNEIGTGGHGEVTESGRYIVKQSMPKCLPEDIDRFESIFLNVVIAFLSHYSNQEKMITELVRAYLDQG